MATTLIPYLSFKDNAAEAMAFYQSVFGGELNVMKFSDMPEAAGPGGMDPADADKLMHSSLKTGTFEIMGADTPSGTDHQAAAGTSLMVGGGGEDVATLQGWWAKLSEGGTVTMPLAKAPWGDYFGMLTDRFGTPWMFDYGDPEGS
jgi:PhnB protein